jgi:hypothetical protein
VSWNHQTVRGRSHSAQINGDRGVPIGYTSRSITCHSPNPILMIFVRWATDEPLRTNRSVILPTVAPFDLLRPKLTRVLFTGFVCSK